MIGLLTLLLSGLSHLKQTVMALTLLIEINISPYIGENASTNDLILSSIKILLVSQRGRSSNAKRLACETFANIELKLIF